MPTPPKLKVVFAAVAANLGIAIAKFAAAAVTGSAAMTSEGIHSLVDTGNGLLLFVGIRRSQHPPDARHPFGYGKEQYFWSLVVAIVVFAVGGGLSAYEGLSHLMHPRAPQPRWASYAVLGVAFMLEGSSWMIATKEFRKTARRGEGFLSAVRASKDPSVFSVLLEDTAALLGLIVAAVGVSLAWWLDQPRWDAAASVVIGLILAAVAALLASESRELLVGERAAPEVVASIRALADEEAAVERVVQVLTMHLGPNEILLNLNVVFRAGLSTREVGAALERLERRIRATHREVQRIFIDVDGLVAASRVPPRAAGAHSATA